MYVNPGQVVDDMQIEVAVRESREITEVDAMTRVVDNDVYTGMGLFFTLIIYLILLFFVNFQIGNVIIFFFFLLHET